MKTKLILLSLLTFISCQNKKETPSLIESNRVGIEILKRAKVKHGDFLSDSLQIIFEATNKNYVNPGQ